MKWHSWTQAPETGLFTDTPHSARQIRQQSEQLRTHDCSFKISLTKGWSLGSTQSGVI